MMMCFDDVCYDDDDDTSVDDKNYEDSKISCGRFIAPPPRPFVPISVRFQCRYL